jgi:hypothetical protein
LPYTALLLPASGAVPSLRYVAPTAHCYRSGELGLFLNSYLVEGSDGVVAVEAPLLLSDGRAFRARLEALRKPLLAAPKNRSPACAPCTSATAVPSCPPSSPSSAATY